MESVANMPMKVVAFVMKPQVSGLRGKFVYFMQLSRWQLLSLLPHCPSLNLEPDTKKEAQHPINNQDPKLKLCCFCLCFSKCFPHSIPGSVFEDEYFSLLN